MLKQSKTMWVRTLVCTVGRSPTILISAATLMIVLSTVQTTAAQPDPKEQLERSRNLGKAFYENPTTSAEAVAEFKKALPPIAKN